MEAQLFSSFRSTPEISVFHSEKYDEFVGFAGSLSFFLLRYLSVCCVLIVRSFAELFLHARFQFGRVPHDPLLVSVAIYSCTFARMRVRATRSVASTPLSAALTSVPFTLIVLLFLFLLVF